MFRVIHASHPHHYTQSAASQLIPPRDVSRPPPVDQAAVSHAAPPQAY